MHMVNAHMMVLDPRLIGVGQDQHGTKHRRIGHVRRSSMQHLVVHGCPAGQASGCFQWYGVGTDVGVGTGKGPLELKRCPLSCDVKTPSGMSCPPQAMGGNASAARR